MTDVERYQFDRQGYLVVKDVLDESAVGELNSLIDQQNLEEPPQVSSEGRFGGFLEWGQPFCDLLDHQRIMPILRELLGDGFRLDHYYGIHLRAGTPSSGLHGGGTPRLPRRNFHEYRNGRMYEGMTVVGWNLRDTGPDHGGFCCLPGSHKANYPCPDGITEPFADAETLGDVPDSVVIPEAPAGSVVIFTEALTHATTPWVADHHRRSLLFKYNPGLQNYSEGVLEPPEGADLTPRQEKLFEPPYDSDRPSLFEDDR